MPDINYQKRLLLLCEELLDLTPSERLDALQGRPEIDAGLRSDVLAMLQTIEQDEDSSDRPRHAFEYLGRQVPRSGDEIAGWLLEDKLGSGGMGVVYRARRRAVNSQQQTALKLLDSQIVTRSMRARFNAERDILARLRHPYIAGLVDGGTTDAGVPWIAMELVEGIRIDNYCDVNRLTIDQRLALLEKVAGALQHAHQNLVIHRDVKPSNILVTSDGIPKLVDFGIAKLLEQEVDSELAASGANPALTAQFGSTALTPDYASPEQILRGDMSTASDIYSLGIVSLQLFTGNLPYKFGQSTPGQMIRHMESTTAPVVSALINQISDQELLDKLAMQRGTSVRRLRKQLGGDLEVVLAKATHREPERRYSSAQELAADFQASRRSQPVSARKDSLGYRIRSMVRANRLAVSVVGATVVALSVGLIAALWQARLANERFTDLHQFAQIVIGDVYDEVSDLPGSISARRLIAAEAQRYLDRLVSLKLADDELIGDLSFAYRRLADVQGWPSNANLGQSEEALVNYQRATELLGLLEVVTPKNRQEQGHILRRSADVLAWQGYPDRALILLQESRSLFEELLKLAPSEPSSHINLGYNLVNLGDKSGHPSFQNVGDQTAAREYYRRAIALLSPVAQDSANRELLRCYAVALERAGTMALGADEITNALEHYGESRDIRVRLAVAHPDHANIQRDAGIASESLAKVYRRQGNYAAAVAAFEKALRVYQRLANIDVQNVGAQRTVIIGMENLADTLRLNSEPGRARDLYESAREQMGLLVEKDPSSERLVSELLEISQKLDSFDAESNPLKI